MWPFDRKEDTTSTEHEAQDWRRYGRADQEAAEQTGYETPGRLTDNAKYDGELYGAARVDRDEALGLGSGPRKRIDGGSNARKGVAVRDHYRARVPLAQRMATREDRKTAKAVLRTMLAERLRVLTEERLPHFRQTREQTKQELAYEREGFAELPRHRQGYFDHFGYVALVEVLVVAFDVAVLYPALKHAGLGLEGGALYYVALATPLALLAINLSLGLLAGALVLRISSIGRLRVVLLGLAMGCLGLFVIFLLLAIFRAHATDIHNQAAQTHHGLRSYISPWWLAPLQMLGSLAAISIMALYVTGRDGRAQSKVIAASESSLESADGKVQAVEDEIDTVRRQIEQAAVAVPEIDADAAAAKTEVVLGKHALRAELEAEDGLRETAEGRFRTAYIYTDKIFGNGGVWRVALPTLVRFGRRHTPPPQDEKAAPRPPQPPVNGGGAVNPEDLDSFAPAEN
jgi:hypothetical protein